jgi:hypothetical protein
MQASTMRGRRRRTFALVITATAMLAGWATPPGEATQSPPETISTGSTPSSPTVPATTTTTTPAARPIVDATWTLVFGGDTLLTRTIPATTDPFAGIRPPLADADLAIVNLETAISTRGRAQAKEFTFRSLPSFADRLDAAGIDVVSLANNHTLDFGLDALNDTIANLDRVDVAHVGAGRSVSEALAPVEFEINSTAVAVLGASQIIPNGAWPATPIRPGIASAGKHVINRETRQLLDAVQRARTTNDVVIVVLHWGIEGDPCPSGVQRELATQLVRAGATAVLGAHPHILQPIVRVPGLTGDALVAYSLGNFIWDPRGGATADTGVVELRFDGGRLADATFHPHRLDGRGWAHAVGTNTAQGRAITSRVTRRCPGVTGSPVGA